MNRNIIKTYTLLPLLLVMLHCSTPQKEANNPKQQSTIKLATPPQNITAHSNDTIAMARKPTETETIITGHLTVMANNQIDVGTQLPGFINTITVTPGTKIKKGQLLATLSHPDIIKLQADFIEVKLKIDLSEKKLNRSEKLKGDLISEAETEQLRSDLSILKNTYQSLLAQLNLAGINTAQLIATQKPQMQLPITAPQGGTVAKLHVTKGMFISNNQSILSIIDKSKTRIIFEVFAPDATGLKIGDTITFNTPTNSQNHTCTVTGINPVGNAETQIVKVYAKVNNTNLENWPTGTYVTGILPKP